jgi:hypothetical protein
MKPTLKFAHYSFSPFLFKDAKTWMIPAPINLEVQDFIWKGLNQYYLWQPDVPNLSDDRFASQNELNAFANLSCS